MKKNFLAVLAAAVIIFASSGQLLAYMLSGDVDNPGNYSAGGDLWTSVLTPATIHVYKGPLNPTGENWIQGDYIRVTGSSGSTAIFSVGELNPTYGNQAVTLTGNLSGGFDLSGSGRSVTDVNGIQVIHAVDALKGGTYSYSNQVSVSGSGITAQSFNLAQLQGMTQSTYDGATAFTGPALLSILGAAGVNTGNLNQVVIAKATDGYTTLLSMYEVVNPISTTADLLAIIASNHSINEGPWTSGTKTKNDNGLTRLVLPGDLATGRWVSNLSSLEVVPTPTPAAIYLLGSGLLGLIGFKRRLLKA
jgi:hypothetical protein